MENENELNKFEEVSSDYSNTQSKFQVVLLVMTFIEINH